ncbi:metal-nicotianamine transporter ysl1 [Phtheirospermum japonicum]|uniref:Metal-nicotianamine transporter ysl1 n=1 Tax=Phtheirospermum japonicum TaxID=374723 RepID=A0A830CCT9_9LAMI|nr:metal-nicotianamine transporter ysl1 [Phtheirospermum japonicum]
MSIDQEMDPKLEIVRENEFEEEAEDEEEVRRVQPWQKQITVRGIIASVVIGSIFSVIAMKLNLTTGITPNLNVSAALLAFVFMRTWSKALHKFGIYSSPFTKQENTMIQTCVVACYSIAVGGGFGSYLLGMNKKTFALSGGLSVVGNFPDSIKEPGIGWMIVFLFLVCFIGLFVLIPLRKILIIDYELTFPSGMATAVLINGFHSRGDKMAKFYFDFSLTYVGTGMICPHVVNLSLLLGAVISYGLMWPLIRNLKGEWFPADIPESSMKSLNGYRVFISIALLLGDGLYNFVKILRITIVNIHGRFKRQNPDSASGVNIDKALIKLRKDEVFVRENIPLWIGAVGYVILALISIVSLPFIIPELKWYHVLLAYIFAPSLAFCNAYGAGLTDINMAYNYGKVGLFTIAAMSGKEHGVIAALAACGLFKSIINVSCILMQDFKTGHLTLTSPRAMLLSQAIGTALGCVITPLSFFLFYKAFDVGNPDGEFKAPYALIYRNLAIIGVQGFSALPRHCLQLCYGFFAFAIGINLVKDLLPKRIGKWMPIPTAMAVPFLIGGYFAIDMCVGSFVVFVWHKLNAKQAEVMVPAMASGFICGEGIWTLPASVLALAKITPPICMNFLPG